jgi:hypothetical protein
MEDRKTIFTYIGETFATYGIIVFLFVLITAGIGKDAEGYSTFFTFGNRAISLHTLLQLLGLAVVISICRNVLFDDRWIRSMSMLARNVLFFLIITVTIVLFVILFGWFPINDMKAWIGFFISFAVSSTVAVVLSRIRERTENDKMNRALEKYNGGK